MEQSFRLHCYYISRLAELMKNYKCLLFLQHNRLHLSMSREVEEGSLSCLSTLFQDHMDQVGNWRYIDKEVGLWCYCKYQSYLNNLLWQGMSMEVALDILEGLN